MTPEALERWRYWQQRFKKLLGKPARKMKAKATEPILRRLTKQHPRRQRRAKATVAASGEATATATRTIAAEAREPKTLSADQRLELLKVAASAPRPPKRPAPTSAAVKPPPPAVKSPAPSAPERPPGREREQLGIGFCTACRRREPLFRHRHEGLCRNCHPYGGQLDAA